MRSRRPPRGVRHRLQRERDVSGRCAPRQQGLRIVLEDDRHVAARRLDRRSGESDLAARRGDQAGGDPQRRGLTASGGTDDAHDLARPDFERQLAQHKMIAKDEVDASKGDERRGGHAGLAPASG